MTNPRARPVDGTGELVLGRLLDGAADLHIGRPRGDPIEAVVGVLDARDDAGADGVLQLVTMGALAGADARADGFLLPVLSLAGSGGDAGSAAGVLHYDHAVPRGAGATTSSNWRPAAGRGAGATSGWRAHDPAGTTTISGWSPAGAGAATASAPWSAQAERAGSTSSVWCAAVPAVTESAAPWCAMPERTRELALVHRAAMPASTGLVAPWIDLLPRAGTTAQAWRDAGSAAIGVEASASPAAPLQIAAGIPWQEARRPAYGYTPPPIPIPPTPTPPPPGTVPPPPPAGSPPTRLHLARRIEGAPTVLWLGRADPVGIRIPALRAYIVVNQIRMWRVPDGTPISPTSVSINTDADSWTWSLSASIPRAALHLVEPTADGPAEIHVEANGLGWRFIVETIDEAREFARGQVSINGRSLVAYLADPYAPRSARYTTAPITAQQLAEQALENTGTTLDWRLTDWLVSPTCWSMDSATPLDVIARLAEAPGATVLAGPDTQSFRIAPRYPVDPWDWGAATPDIILPQGPVRSLKRTLKRLPRYNAVYLTGDREGGITARALRRGTAGDLLAPQVTDSLITDVAVARTRAATVLANTGTQADVELQLPMLTDLGRLLPGQLLELEGDGASSWRGLIRAVSITAAVADKSTTIWQNINVERHYL